ncbi:MAG: protein kinase [Clostridia bacterium]|nr:protein kinase [Clostridia bacterium]
MKRCLSCFKEYNDELNKCPYCGAKEDISADEPIHLAPGTILNGRYLIGKALGSGGFGILYKAWDLKLEAVVAVKEFFCSRLMTRAVGIPEVIVGKKPETISEFSYRKDRFLDEARNLAKFTGGKFIPNVFEYFEENKTAYFVMEYLEGTDLRHYLEQNKNLTPDFAVYIANSVGNALCELHSKGIVHRDVAPDNIFIKSDKELNVVLLDLGAAYLPDAKSDAIDIILKPGYSPPEQYNSMSDVGIWSDIYALGATLYTALTGVKPDESSNRKTEDTVVPPNELNPEVPENLSNAIMKAMAIEPHMRFKSVKEFLRAINGERKVTTLKKEKKRRRRIRFGSIIAACVVLAILGTSVWQVYDKERSEQYLKDAYITIWCNAQEDSPKGKAIKSVVDDFNTKFENVKTELKMIPGDEYFTELEKAAESGTLPNLFESSNISEKVLNKAEDVSKILDSEQAKDCLFLGQYDSYYKTKKQIPLGIEIPMACVITKGVASVDYEKEYFSSVSDFGTAAIALAEGTDNLIFKNIQKTDFAPDTTFFDNSNNSSAVLLTSTMQINKIREELTNYSKHFVFCDSDKIYCNFIYEWSIGKANRSQTAASERLLSWMLGNAYQNTLMISKCSDGQIPVNKTCFEEKTSGKNYKAIKEIYEKFVF